MHNFFLILYSNCTVFFSLCLAISCLLSLCGQHFRPATSVAITGVIFVIGIYENHNYNFLDDLFFFNFKCAFYALVDRSRLNQKKKHCFHFSIAKSKQSCSSYICFCLFTFRTAIAGMQIFFPCCNQRNSNAIHVHQRYELTKIVLDGL